MKKIVIGVFVLLSLSVCCVYVFIPKQMKVSEHVTAKTNERWAFNFLMHETSWKDWWPTNSIDDAGADTTFKYNNLWFHIDSLYYNAITIKIANGNDTAKSRIVVFPINSNEVQLAWECNIDGTGNPFTRWMKYRHAVAIKGAMNTILDRYTQWLNVPANIYGFNIKTGRIIDTLLIAARASFEGYPNMRQVDSVMQQLRDHVSLNHAQVVGYPMLNIINDSGNIYNAQVALPINKEIPQTDAFRIKRMFAGNTLLTSIKGGPYTIAKAYEACEHYKHDYSRVSPAVPFQSMITDRIAQPDTGKWETIIYYPVK